MTTRSPESLVLPVACDSLTRFKHVTLCTLDQVDLDRLAAFADSSAFDDSHYWNSPHLAGDNWLSFACVDANGQVAAAIALYKELMSDHPFTLDHDRMYLDRIETAVTNRHHGLATGLLSLAAAITVEQKLPSLELTIADGHGSRDFFEKISRKIAMPPDKSDYLIFEGDALNRLANLSL